MGVSTLVAVVVLVVDEDELVNVGDSELETAVLKVVLGIVDVIVNTGGTVEVEVVVLRVVVLVEVEVDVEVVISKNVTLAICGFTSLKTRVIPSAETT